MQEETKTLDDVQVPTETDEQKITRIAGALVNERVNKEIDEIHKLIPVPGDEFHQAAVRSSENKNNPSVIDGRNYLKSIIFNQPDIMPERYKSYLGEASGNTGLNLVPQEW